MPVAQHESQRVQALLTQIQRLDNADFATAEGIHRLLLAAHAQESQTLGAEPGPAPAVQQIQASADVHLGALEQGVLVGVVAVGPHEDPCQLELKWLAVSAACQRRGIGRALLTRVLASGVATFVVTVAQANTGALALYRSMGFVHSRSGVLGEQGVPVFRLCAHRLP